MIFMKKTFLLFICLFRLAFAQVIVVDETKVSAPVRATNNCLVNVNIDNSSDIPVKRQFHSQQFSTANLPEYGTPENVLRGTAFVFYDNVSKNNYLITAAHVVTSSFPTKIFKGNDSLNIKIANWVWDSQKDIAIAQILSPSLPQTIKPIEFADLKMPKKGDTTYIPLGNSLFNQGVIQDTDANSNDNIAAYHLLQCSNNVKEGQSGSPIFDKEGRIIGILLRKMTENNKDACFALDRQTFAKLFTQLQREGKAKRFYTGIVFDINKNGKPIIKSYLPGSPAEKQDYASNYTNGVITSINNQPITSLKDIHKIMEELPDSEGDMLLFYKIDGNREFSLLAKNSTNVEQETIANYFLQKYINDSQQGKPWDISEVHIKSGGSIKYIYEIRAASELGGVIRTFSWNTQLLFIERNSGENHTHLTKDGLGDIKNVLIF